MSEWSKEHAWKVCVLQKGTVGSNPTLSADFQAVRLQFSPNGTKHIFNKRANLSLY